MPQDTNVPTWDEVAQSVPEDQREAARKQYFVDVVAPQVPTDQLQAAFAQFDADTRPVGTLERVGKAIKEVVTPKALPEWGAGNKFKAPEGVTDDTFSAGVPESAAPAPVRKTGSVMDGYAAPAARDAAATGGVPLLPERQKQLETIAQRSPNVAAKIAEQDNWAGQAMRAIIGRQAQAAERLQTGQNIATPTPAEAFARLEAPHGTEIGPGGEDNPKLGYNEKGVIGKGVSTLTSGVEQGFWGVQDGVLGAAQFLARGAGAKDYADSIQQRQEELKRRQTDLALPQNAEYFSKMVQSATSSITQNVPGLLTGAEAPALTTMGLQSFGQEFGSGRAAGMTDAEATVRAGIFAAAEVLGEKFGLGDTLKGLKASAQGVPTRELAKYFGRAFVKEVPGEQLTSAIEFGADKYLPQGINKDATFDDYLRVVGDTFVQTILQSGMMMGGGAAISQGAQALDRAMPAQAIARALREQVEGSDFDRAGIDRYARALLDPNVTDSTVLAPEQRQPFLPAAAQPNPATPPETPVGHGSATDTSTLPDLAPTALEDAIPDTTTSPVAGELAALQGVQPEGAQHERQEAPAAVVPGEVAAPVASSSAPAVGATAGAAQRDAQGQDESLLIAGRPPASHTPDSLNLLINHHPDPSVQQQAKDELDRRQEGGPLEETIRRVTGDAGAAITPLASLPSAGTGRAATRGITRETGTVASAIAAVGGHKVLFFTPREAGQSAFVIPAADREHIFINAASSDQTSLYATTGHEIYHHLRQQSPELARQFEDVVRAVSKIDLGSDAGLLAYLPSYWSGQVSEQQIAEARSAGKSDTQILDDILARAGDYDRAMLREEFYGDVFGSRFKEKGFWSGVVKEMARTDVGLLARFRLVLDRIVKAVSRYNGEAFGADKFIRDLEAVRTEAARVYAQYASRKGPQERIRKMTPAELLATKKSHPDDIIRDMAEAELKRREVEGAYAQREQQVAKEREQVHTEAKDDQIAQAVATHRAAGGDEPAKTTVAAALERAKALKGELQKMKDQARGAAQVQDNEQGRFSPKRAEPVALPGNAQSEDAAPTRINFEVAPDPNDAALANAWNSLPVEDRHAISRDIAQDVVPKALKAFGVEGELVPQVGSYLDDTNTSFSLVLHDAAKADDLQRFLGYVLSQDSMMTVGEEAFPGAEPVGSVTVMLEGADPKQIYDQLRGIEVDGERVVSGQSTANDMMSILNYSSVSTDELARLIDVRLANKYRVLKRDVFASFPSKEEYGYASGGFERQAAAGGAPLQGDADRLRSEATRAVREAIDARAGPGDVARAGKRDRPAKSDSEVKQSPARASLADVFKEIARKSEFFRYKVSSADTLERVAGDLDPLVAVKDVSKWRNDGARMWRLAVPMENGRSKDAYIFEKGDEVWLNVASVGEGAGGHAVYAIAGNYARNAGKVFIGDPEGISLAGMRRRVENMMSLALKFGTTDFLEPHADMEKKLGLKWKPGDDAFNLESLLTTAYEVNRQLVPEIKNVRFNFDDGKFYRGDRLYDDATFARAAAQLRAAGGTAAAGAPGIGSLKVSAVVGSILRSEDPARWGQVLAAVRERGTEKVWPSLERVRYSPERQPIFYSQLARAFETARQDVQPAAQWKLWLAANQSKLSIKKDEVLWSGITDWLDLQGKAKVSKQQIADYLAHNGVQVEETFLDDKATGGRTTRYAQYQLPGGENYRELLLTLPGKNPIPLVSIFSKEGDLPLQRVPRDSGEAQAALSRPDIYRVEEYKGDRDAFRSSHFDQPNILAHVRFNAREDAEGRRVLFVEEIQSDWAQKGKREGFGRESMSHERLRELIEENDRNAETEGLTRAELLELAATSDVKGGPIPAAPFVTETRAWVALALKRVMRYAAENGFERIAWTTGEQQSERYDLAKRADQVLWDAARDDKTGDLILRKDGGNVLVQRGVAAEDLQNHIGKEIAERLLKAEKNRYGMRELSGLELQVGGEGMKAFYDQIVPQVANDLLKKLGGGKVATVTIDAPKGKPTQYADFNAWKNAPDVAHLQQPGFEVPPAAAGAQPLFSPFRKALQRLDAAIDGLSNLPDQFDYLKDRYRTLGRIARVDEIISEIRDTFKQAAQADKYAVYAYLTTQGANANMIGPADLRDAALRIKRTINYVGDQLVARGLLDPAARAHYRDQYLPRMYLKHLLTEQEWAMIGAGKKPSEMGYLKHRKDIPQEVRDIILGEIKDPAFLASQAIGRAMRDIALLDWLARISQNQGWVFPGVMVPFRGQNVSAYWLKAEADRIENQSKHYTPANQARAAQLVDAMRQAADGALQNLPFVQAGGTVELDHNKYKQIPDTHRYGLLRGLLVRKEIHADIMGLNSVVNHDPTWFEQIFGIGHLGTRLTQYWKFSKVAANPPGQVRNFISNMVMLQLSGIGLHRLPIRMVQAMRDITNNGPYWQVAKKYGVTEATFTAQELYRIKEDLLALEGQASRLNPLTWIKLAGLHLFDKLSDLYQFSEAMGKTAKIIDEMKAGKSEAEAALEAQKWLFDYSLIPQWVRVARNSPVGMPFITYQVKVLPRLLEVAATAPWRFLPWLALLYGMQQYVAGVFGVDPDELKKLKKSLPEWLREKGHALFLPWKDTDGRVQVADVGYFFPWTFYTEAAGHAGEPKKLLGDLGGMFSAPIIGSASNLLSNYDSFTKKPIYNEADPPSYQAAAIANYLYDLAAPPIISSHGVVSPMGFLDKQYGGKAWQAASGTTNKFGDPKATAGQAAAAAFGFNFYGMDPDHTRAQNVQAMVGKVQDAEKSLAKRLMDRSLTSAERAKAVADYRARMLDLGEEAKKYAEDSKVPDVLKVKK